VKRAKRTIVILSLAALASCRGPAAIPTATPQIIPVRLLATTATYPLLQDFAASYSTPGVLLALTSTTANWQTVYAALQAGEAPFALTSYLPPDTALWAAEVARDGIVIIVHPGSGVPALTLDDLRRVFQGRVTSWAELGGTDLPVIVVSREAGADTRLAFEALVMGGWRTSPGAELALSSQSVVERVAREPGAVGYVSLAYLDDRVNAVPLAAQPGSVPVLPTRATVSAGRYPLSIPILVVGLTPPAENSLYRRWFAWMQSAAGQRVAGQHYGTLSP
jgi:phosphate transport system substrate-binding protein